MRQIPVVRISDKREPSLLVPAVSLVVGVFLGVIIAQGSYPLPIPESWRTQLGAVSASTENQDTGGTANASSSASTEKEDSDSIQIPVYAYKNTQPQNNTSNNSDSQQENLLLTVISEKEINIARLNLQITAIKSAGVHIIERFTQNCNNWNDTCADVYKTELEANNNTYNQLEKSLRLESAEYQLPLEQR